MTRSRWLSLLILCTGFLLIVVDMTIVNVALPSIGRDLRFTPEGLAWVINGYLVAFAGLLLLAGRLADLWGAKRVFVAGLVIFTAASAACGLAPSQEILVAARFVQGVGGAASSAVILAMIVSLFPSPAEQARAFGIFSLVASAGAAVGLVAGGVITSAVSWHWVFFVNIPVGLATLACALRMLPSVPGVGLQAGADVAGAVVGTSALMLGVYAIVAPSPGMGLVALVLFAAFIARQATARTPMVPLRIFRSGTVSGSNAVQTLLSAGFLSFFFLGSLDLERVLGYGPLAIGLAFLPVAVVMGGFSIRFSAQLVTRYGAYPVIVCGQVVIAAALLILGVGPVHADYLGNLLLPMVMLGLGAGLTFPALTMLAMSGAAPTDAGLASGLLNTTGQVGGALGLAVLAALSAARSGALAGAGATPSLALAGGFHTAWLAAAAVVGIALLVTVVTLRPAGSAASDRQAVPEAA
jgi:EmrB/QacA subfamily drug resistance transporter